MDPEEPRRYPAGPRVFAGILAVLGGLVFGAALPGGLEARGYPLTATVMAATAAPVVLVLALLALSPSLLERPARRFTRIDLTDGAHVGAAMIMAVALYFVLGYGALTSGAFAYESEIVRGDEPQPLTGNDVLSGLAINAVALVLPVVIYVSFVRDPAARGPLDAIGLRREGAPRALALGVGTAFGVLLLIAVLGGAAQAVGYEMDENERALEIARGVTVLGALAVAVGSSVTEEVFFRGFLQPRIGLWGQAIVFGLAHLTYLHVFEIVVTFALALLFGWLYKRTGNLWGPIAGHFTFNLVMLLIAQYVPTPTPA